MFGLAGGQVQGHAYLSVIDRLVTATDQTKRRHPDDVVIWASHFPPGRDGDASLARRQLALIRSDRLVEAASRRGVPLIVAGHLHGFDYYDRGTVKVLVAGSASCMSRSASNSMHVLEIAVDDTHRPNLRYETFCYDESRSDFWRDRSFGVDETL